MTKKEDEALLIFERKILRRIYGPKNENVEWKSRTNLELEEISVDKKNQLDVTFCILYFSSNSCSTCFG